MIGVHSLSRIKGVCERGKWIKLGIIASMGQVWQNML